MDHFPKEWFKKDPTWTPLFLTMVELKVQLKNSPENTTERKYFDLLTKNQQIDRSDRLSCLQVLALFLMMTYNCTSIQFYREMVVFVCALIRCLEKHGPEVYRKVYAKSYEDRMAYCESQDADLVPEIADRFVKDFLPRFLLDSQQFDQLAFMQFLGVEPFKLTRVVMLMRYLCIWLYQMDLTQFEISFSAERMKVFDENKNNPNN